eukprot:scaffold213663_cov15-Tisochrysis_lutea.AAC.1
MPAETTSTPSCITPTAMGVAASVAVAVAAAVAAASVAAVPAVLHSARSRLGCAVLWQAPTITTVLGWDCWPASPAPGPGQEKRESGNKGISFLKANASAYLATTGCFKCSRQFHGHVLECKSASSITRMQIRRPGTPDKTRHYN